MGFSKYASQVQERCVASKAYGPARMQVRPCLVRSLRSLDCSVGNGQVAATAGRKGCATDSLRAGLLFISRQPARLRAKLSDP